MSNKKNLSQNEINIQNILIASESALTLRDISYQTGLSVSEVSSLIKADPSIHKKVLDRLSASREKLSNNIKEMSNNTNNQLNSKKYVLDTCFICNNLSSLEEMVNNGYQFVITNVVLNELYYSKNLCNYIALHPESFDVVLIDDTRYDYVDNMLVKFCASDIKNLALATSDIQLTLKARMFGIEVWYSPAPNSNDSITVKHKKKNKKNKCKENKNNAVKSNSVSSDSIDSSKIKPSAIICNEAGFNEFPSSLSFVDYKDGHLEISKFKNSVSTKIVISNGSTYTEGTINLNLGDEIYTAEYWHRKEKDFITFRHYKIISISKTNYAQLIYSKKLDSDDSNVKDYYKSFINSFKETHNCKF